jgi:hypothetical protein
MLRKKWEFPYLKTVHNQLSALFNHAVRYYGLKSNPAAIAGNMGTEECEEMQFWTLEEYNKFSEAMMEKTISFYAFEMLYWCGVREGEMLALTPKDFDFKAETVTINKSYQRLKGRDVITTPTRMSKLLCQRQKHLNLGRKLKRFMRLSDTATRCQTPHLKKSTSKFKISFQFLRTRLSQKIRNLPPLPPRN